MREPRPLSDEDLVLVHAFAEVASIAIVQAEAAREAAFRERQLQHALDSRIAVEQAKGMIAERGTVEMDEAFIRLRQCARDQNRRLSDVAESLVAGMLSVDLVASVAPHQP